MKLIPSGGAAQAHFFAKGISSKFPGQLISLTEHFDDRNVAKTVSSRCSGVRPQPLQSGLRQEH